MWAPFATRRDGPAWKVGYSYQGEGGPKRGDVKHSAEGYWPGIYSRLDGPDRASWHFTVGYDRVEQHYPITAFCWHAGDVDDDGGVAANIDLVGIEHLGVRGEPLTPYQVEMTTKITRWCADQFLLRTFSRYPAQDGWTLVEHNQVSDVATACPSARIPWLPILVALTAPQEEDEMIHLIRPNNAAYTYATDGVSRWYVPNPDVLRELQDAGVLPPEVKVLTPAAVQAIPLIPSGLTIRAVIQGVGTPR